MKRKTANKLTFAKRAIADLKPPGTGRIYFYDDKVPGLCLCITATDVRTFYLSKRIAGRWVRHRLGRLDELTIEQARKQADLLKGKIAAGEDPQSVRRAKRGELTFGELHEAWMSHNVRPRRAATTIKEYSRIFAANLISWSDRRVSEITSGDVAALHVRLGKNSPYMANRGEFPGKR